MTIRDIQGRLFQPGFIADIPSGNLVWVDPVNGNDDMAIRGRMTVPFKTLTKAKAAAVSGDTIIVLPGTYNENNLLKNGVNWQFMPGASVRYTGNGSSGIFDTSSNGTNGAVDCLISGWGDFRVENAVTTGHVVYSAANSSSITIYARRMVSSVAACVKTANAAGRLSVNVMEDINSSSGRAVEIGGTAGSSNENIIRAYKLYSSGAPGLFVSGGNVDVQADYVSSSADAAVSIQGGIGSNIVIRAYELLASSTYAVYYNSTNNPELTIIGSRVRSNFNNAAGHAIYVAAGGSTKIKLSGCVLLSQHASSKSISAVSNTTVQLSGFSVGKWGNALITFVPNGSPPWTTDTNLS